MPMSTQPVNALSPATSADAGDVWRAQAGRVAGLLKAVANRQRLLILCQLLAGEQSVSALNRQLPLSPSALSQHLACLRKARWVSCRKQAHCVFYRLNGPEATQLLALLHTLYCPKLGDTP